MTAYEVTLAGKGREATTPHHITTTPAHGEVVLPAVNGSNVGAEGGFRRHRCCRVEHDTAAEVSAPVPCVHVPH